MHATRNPRTVWFVQRSARVGAIFLGFYWFWCGAVRGSLSETIIQMKLDAIVKKH